MKISEKKIVEIIKETMKTCNRSEVQWMIEEQKELYKSINKKLEGMK